MANKKKKDFLVNKSNLAKTIFQENEISPLAIGDVLLKIDKYAFTSNNITYAVIAPKLQYWDFFPAAEPWGIVPAWGFANVVDSKHKGVKKGERFYGYFPMSSHLKVQPGNTGTYGFADNSAHRQHLSAIYNRYSRVDIAPGFAKEKENYQPIFKPLFTTSFLIYHFLKDSDFFNSENITLTSASSKTALSLAFLLNKNKATDRKKIIGLTSNKNIDFVKNSGYYDEVITYDNALNDLSKSASIVIDFAGNSTLLNNIYKLLGGQLKHIALIGLTDWQSEKEFKNIPVAQFFFAPTHIQTKYKEWGAEKTNALLSEGLNEFISVVSEWMEISFIRNDKELSELYLGMLKGEVDPGKGCIVKV